MVRPVTGADLYRAFYKTLFRINERHDRRTPASPYINDNSAPGAA